MSAGIFSDSILFMLMLMLMLMLKHKVPRRYCVTFLVFLIDCASEGLDLTLASDDGALGDLCF